MNIQLKKTSGDKWQFQILRDVETGGFLLFKEGDIVEGYHAKKYTNGATRSGVLLKVTRCSNCGETAEGFFFLPNGYGFYKGVKKLNTDGLNIITGGVGGINTKSIISVAAGGLVVFLVLKELKVI